MGKRNFDDCSHVEVTSDSCDWCGVPASTIINDLAAELQLLRRLKDAAIGVVSEYDPETDGPDLGCRALYAVLTEYNNQFGGDE